VPLVERLCDGRAIDVRGAAMTARLVSDSRGPLYRKGDLRQALRAARMALDERDAGGWQLRRAAYQRRLKPSGALTPRPPSRVCLRQRQARQLL
jgi:hypothetical protein